MVSTIIFPMRLESSIFSLSSLEKHRRVEGREREKKERGGQEQKKEEEERRQKGERIINGRK